MFLLSQNIQALPPPTADVYEKHRDYVDSIILMQEKPAIKEQMKNGIPAHSVMCNNDFVLLLKWTSNKSACVSSQTAEDLIERNWGVYRENVNVLGFDDNDPYKFFGVMGGSSFISFEYNDSEYSETKFIKKIREKFSEHLNESGWSGNHWAYMWIDKESEGHFTLSIAGGPREDFLRGPLEKVEGVSNIENYYVQV